MNKKILGVIGGLGPMATAYFLRLVTDMTDADTDQEHIETVVLSRPATPDRTGYILGKSKENPLPELLKMEDDLCMLGANVIAMPCITAHYFQKELVEHISQYQGAYIIDGIQETVNYLKECGITACGIMATDGTVSSGLFQKALKNAGIKYIVPSVQAQTKVMDIIYNSVKKGITVNINDFNYVTEELRASGSEVILLGCTELSMVKRDNHLEEDIIDVLEILARKAVMECGSLKGKYIRLSEAKDAE